MWGLTESGMEPTSPASARGVLTTGLPGKSFAVIFNATVHHWETEPTGDVDTDIDMNTVIVSISFTITVRNWFMQLWTLRSPRSEVSKLETSQWCKSQTWAESEDWYPSSKKGRERIPYHPVFYFIPAFNRLDEAYPPWGGKSALLSLIVVVTQSCPTLCDPMNWSTPGFPVFHYLPELAQTHIHWVIKPSNHLILCRPLLLLPSIFPSIRVFQLC